MHWKLSIGGDSSHKWLNYETARSAQNSGRKMFVRIIVPTWQSVSFQDPTTWHRSQGFSTLVGTSHIFPQPSIFSVLKRAIFHIIKFLTSPKPSMINSFFNGSVLDIFLSFRNHLCYYFPHFVDIAQKCACIPQSWFAFCDWPSATKLRCSQTRIDRW